MKPKSPGWLIIDQKDYRDQWLSSNANQMGVVFDSNGLRDICPHESLELSPHNTVAILFPCDRDASQYDSVLNKLDIANDWRVWCHYGSDIYLKDVDDRWARFNRLSPEVKRSIGKAPRPYSLAMTSQKWWPHFEELRDRCKDIQKNQSANNHSAGMNAYSKDLMQCLSLLDKAWKLADGQETLWKRQREANWQLPVLVNMILIKDRCQILLKNPILCLATMVELYHPNRKLFYSRRPYFNASVCDIFEKVDDAITDAKFLLSYRSTDERHIKSICYAALAAINSLIWHARKHADSLSIDLERR